jgi:murein L,D-transpeptidase YcbB/YkuD
MRSFIFAIVAFLTANSLSSCRPGDGQNTPAADTSITTENAFNDLFLDSLTIVDFVKKFPAYRPLLNKYFQFYLPRNYSYAWFDNDGWGEQASQLFNLVNNTISLYNDSSLYEQSAFRVFNDVTTNNKIKKSERASAELLLSGTFFKYVAKVYEGTDSDLTKLGWFIPRKKTEYAHILETLEPGDNKMLFPGNHLQYFALEKFLAQYTGLCQSDFDTLPLPDRSFHIGDSSKVIALIRKNLWRWGDLSEPDSGRLFDSALYKAVLRAEKRFGLKEDGIIGQALIKELNIKPSVRLQQILLNMERLRWMPVQQDSSYIFVNIPEYTMYVYDSSRLQFTMNVIVGKVATSTTIFSGNLKFIVFSPYWNVPYSIVKNEILPGMKRSSSYLARHNMEVIGKGPGGLPAIRQRPGGGNSLGRVKFLFPNSYDIYFHDTPNKGLFAANNRSFSHGCIRVSEPKKLASYLLRNDTTWNEAKIDSVMHLKKEKSVTLRKTVPVTLGYFTAFVDEFGLLHFRKDIYKHDSALASKLFIHSK